MPDKMTAEKWFLESIQAGKYDPDFLTAELLLDVTEQIYVRMTKLDLRPSELAERLGVSRAYISQLLNGKPNMTMRTLVGVANALDQKVQIYLENREG